MQVPTTPLLDLFIFDRTGSRIKKPAHLHGPLWELVLLDRLAQLARLDRMDRTDQMEQLVRLAQLVQPDQPQALLKK